MHDAGQPPAFQGNTRRQALPAIRVAACWDSCGGGIARLSHPPHPPTEKAPPTSGKPREGGGPGHSFYQCRVPGALQKTRGSGLPNWRNPHGCKAAARFGPVEYPQVCSFFTQVGVFSPHMQFLRRGPFSSSLLLFLEERERREGANASKRASTSLFFCNRKYPQVGGGIHGFSVDGFRRGFVDWRGFAPGSGWFPRSTGGNACVAPSALVFWRCAWR